MIPKFVTTHQQIADAYRRMAVEARYRPAAPSDGLGNITRPLEELDLDTEADEYARHWVEEENSAQYWVGVCDYPTRPATIFAIEAARSLCGTNSGLARDLLRMALSDLGPDESNSNSD